MQDKKKKPKWHVTTQSIYSFGREERLQSAYEVVLPTEKIALKGKDDVKFKIVKNRTVCSGIE
ncbi:hypothetical protein [Rickettsia endosymbiont of Orchestes rusci]|uniref:hypothetical protein n=1 Tax=Rickettsia endosymbiont of Orchestes rusci TaxID=3066250 RepID=UPI00313C0612